MYENAAFAVNWKDIHHSKTAVNPLFLHQRMEDFSMNRQFYDVALKMSVSNESQTDNETYATLAHK